MTCCGRGAAPETVIGDELVRAGLADPALADLVDGPAKTLLNTIAAATGAYGKRNLLIVRHELPPVGTNARVA